MGFLTSARAALGLGTLSETPLGTYAADVTPPARSAAPLVTVDRALGLPAVYRAIVLIAGMAAQLELKSYRGLALVDPAHPLTIQPDPWRSLSSWVERAVVGLATDGNAFLRRHRDPLNPTATVGLEVLNPFRVTILRDAKTGAKSYAYTHEHTNRYEKLAAADVIHVWGLEVPGLDRGLGPIAWCRLSLAGALDVRDYAAQWFRSGDTPSGVLTTDQRLDPEMGKAYKRAFLGLKEDGTLEDPTQVGPSVKVLGQGLTYAPIALNPEDAQWIEAQKFGVLDVARIFGLPADYLLAAVDGTSLTYANLEMIDAQFLRTTLFPSYLRKLEAAVTEALPRGQRARFDASELLRPDAKTRAEIDAIHLAHGVVAAQDVRDRERIPGTAPGKPAPAPATAPTEEPVR